ncbi:EAL and HDOD domain-containing protein [Variovorax sp. RA8]|uniref:EAL and HDOD domain-containing protein n=1 Tax=Variovorax sp. (strain JCM 16519 / RA8) TaxID=662548 RepID=UPI0013171DE4|nr:HDOD domain-containing protein [Variovorax sp. RA8]VTU29496.1 HDOD domain protein [Variovorax sp. RA8]
MRFNFFRRTNEVPACAVEANESAEGEAMHVEAGGFVTYDLLLDAQKRVKGFKLAWRMALPHVQPNAVESLRALLSCVATNLNPPKTGWRLGRLVLFFDMTVDGLFLNELQAVPPENVVLCMGLDDLMNADIRSTLLHLRTQGYGFMLCGAEVLPEDVELCSIISYVDVGDGHPELVTNIRREQPLGTPVIQPIATHMTTWQDFDNCAARRLDVFVQGKEAIVPTMEAEAILQPESMLIVRLMQTIRRNEDLRTIEAALKHDAALTYRLLRHINSPGIGIGVQIQSLRHAVAMFGYSPLFRWLSVLLATSNKGSAAFMTKKAIVRGRFVELMGQGIVPQEEADNLFVAGMFSLIDRLLGVSLEEVLDKVQLSESVQLAILKREGVYGPFIALAESCEVDGSEASHLSESLFMSAEKVNAAHLSALAWAQDVAPVESAC